jgi:fatty acid/phospholipid biosynthesis enzyme
MARYTLVYGLRLVPEGTLVQTGDVQLTLKDGHTANVTLHTIDGTIPQLRRALDRSLDAFFEFLPGATEEDQRDFDDS